MSDRDDENVIQVHLIDDAVGETADEASPRIPADLMAALRLPGDPIDRRLDLIGDPSPSPCRWES
nr:hypothetical protein [Tautonia plasticadhaerens]